MAGGALRDISYFISFHSIPFYSFCCYPPPPPPLPFCLTLFRSIRSYPRVLPDSVPSTLLFDFPPRSSREQPTPPPPTAAGVCGGSPRAPPPPTSTLRDPGAFWRGGGRSFTCGLPPPLPRYHSAPLFGEAAPRGAHPIAFLLYFSPQAWIQPLGPQHRFLAAPLPPLQALARCCGAQNGVGSPPSSSQPTLGRFMVVLLARLQGEALTRAAAWQHTAKAAMGRRGSLQGPSVCSNPIGGRTMGVCEDTTQGLEYTPPSQGLSAASHQAGLLQPKLAQAGAVAWVSASMATLGLVLGPTLAPLQDRTARPP